MQSHNRQFLPSASEVRRVLSAFDDVADERGLSPRKRQIYRAWITGFIHWSIKQELRRISPEGKDQFLRAVRGHPQSESRDEAQATGALEFLFGLVWPRIGEEVSLLSGE